MNSGENIFSEMTGTVEINLPGMFFNYSLFLIRHSILPFTARCTRYNIMW